jgi:hypothetical protein
VRQQQVAEHEVGRLRRERQRARVGANAIEAAPESLATPCLLRHRQVAIDSDDARARISATQGRGVLAGAATQVDDDARFELEVLQPIQQLDARE